MNKILAGIIFPIWLILVVLGGAISCTASMMGRLTLAAQIGSFTMVGGMALLATIVIIACVCKIGNTIQTLKN